MSYATDEIAGYLTDGFWEWRGEDRRSFDVKSGGTLTANISSLNEDGQQFARWALEAWTNVSGINFRFVTDAGAHLVFDDEEDGGFVEMNESNGVIHSARINISSAYIVIDGDSIDSNTFRIYLHEIGHALGLGHPGPYMDDATYGEDNIFRSDSWQETVMSYFSQHNDWVLASHAVPVTPMPADIVAIHELYGKPEHINPGDTVYGYQSNVGNYLDLALAELATSEGGGVTPPPPPDITPPPPPGQTGISAGEADAFVGRPVTFTIVDTGGNDRLDFRTDTADQSVDLSPESISDVYGLTGNMVIAEDTIIEQYIGGSGNDVIKGNSAENYLDGGNGNDSLQGMDGADSLVGGDGNDTASYEDSDAGVVVRLHNDKPKSGGHAEGDVLAADIEHLTGSDHNDILAGDGGDNTIRGGEGNDVLYGGPTGGDDLLYGGPGNDKLYGGKGNDALLGGSGWDELRGGPGDDKFYYGSAMWGGPGEDVFIFRSQGFGDILDFADGEDKIDLTAFKNVDSIEDMTVTFSENLARNTYRTVIKVTDDTVFNETEIVLTNFHIDNLDDSDFLF